MDVSTARKGIGGDVTFALFPRITSFRFTQLAKAFDWMLPTDLGIITEVILLSLAKASFFTVYIFEGSIRISSASSAFTQNGKHSAKSKTSIPAIRFFFFITIPHFCLTQFYQTGWIPRSFGLNIV